MTVDPRYVAARRVLLDALDALADQNEAVIVAGGQAVYLRTGDIIPGVAPYTTDGDLALDLARLADAPLLDVMMRDLFTLDTSHDGSVKPGIWIQTIDVEGVGIDISVDLIVPEAIAPPGGRRAARLGPHGDRTARRAVGLEAALVGHDRMPIEALDPNDPRVIHCNVAGPTALLVAKAHKIADRLDDADRLVDKDAADVYRLMQATSVGLVNEVLGGLLHDARAGQATRDGVQHLRRLFGARRAPGVEMAIRSFGPALPADRVRVICTSFIEQLR
ncbi:MAG TPA: hypothetical protein VGA69_01220 [Nitriliruptorales bacterium]